MAKPGVFISYDYGRDKAYKDRLLAWDVKGEFDFSSYDQSFGVGFGTPPAMAVKEDLARRIGLASHFLCIVSELSYRSVWTTWQIRKAIELKKKLVGVKTDSIHNSPPALQAVGATWTTRFDFDSIKQAIG